jgi:hypothetical protein
MVGLDRRVVFDLSNRKRRSACQHLSERAAVIGVKMLDDDKRHAAIRRNVRKQAPKGIDPPGRRTNADDRAYRLPPGPVRFLRLSRRSCFFDVIGHYVPSCSSSPVATTAM